MRWHNGRSRRSRNLYPENAYQGSETKGCFYVRWPAMGERVRFSAGHMLNPYNDPSVIRFLSHLSNDGKATMNSFDWGPAESFQYLPRVQTGRIVLRQAQWRIHKGEIATGPTSAFRDSLERWLADWELPPRICLSAGDNRLVLDLSQDVEAAELKTEIQKLREGESIVIQEVLPNLDEAWLPGDDGHYFSEIVVSLVLRRAPDKSKDSADNPVERKAGSHNPGNAPKAAQISRLRPPGSEWLFLKLYCPRSLENEIVPESMLTFAENALSAGLADSWFFIRYSDPDPHIRLRFHGAPQQLTGHLFGALCSWAAGLMSDGLCLKFAFDTYEPEIERFGGIAGLAMAEALFSIDSRGSAKLLYHLRRKVWPYDETALLALSIDDLLGAIGLSEPERLSWYRTQTDARCRVPVTNSGDERMRCAPYSDTRKSFSKPFPAAR